jgi:hypothetical protein
MSSGANLMPKCVTANGSNLLVIGHMRRLGSINSTRWITNGGASGPFLGLW